VTSKRIIKVGLDFDGVVTYNPFRVARLTVAFIKHQILGIKKIGFFVPKNPWQKLLYYWIIVIPSAFPANGVMFLKKLAQSSDKFEFYLITGRFDFVKDDTIAWLRHQGLINMFKKIYINEKNEQPHEFKKRIINLENFDYFIEDNWDIVNFLNTKKTPVKVYWVYNVFDAFRKYQYKFPHLNKALEYIRDETVG